MSDTNVKTVHIRYCNDKAGRQFIKRKYGNEPKMVGDKCQVRCTKNIDRCKNSKEILVTTVPMWLCTTSVGQKLIMKKYGNKPLPYSDKCYVMCHNNTDSCNKAIKKALKTETKSPQKLIERAIHWIKFLVGH